MASAIHAVGRPVSLPCVAKAIDPTELDAPDGLLDDAHDAALQVEGIAAARGISWTEARQFV